MPCAERRQRRIDRKVERQQRHPQPAKPSRHLRLIGEGRGDPVVADAKVPDAPQPTDQHGAFRVSGSGDQFAKPGHRQQHQRPQVQRLKTERGQCAEQRRGDQGAAQNLVKQLARVRHRWVSGGVECTAQGRDPARAAI